MSFSSLSDIVVLLLDWICGDGDIILELEDLEDATSFNGELFGFSDNWGGDMVFGDEIVMELLLLLLLVVVGTWSRRD